MASKKPTGLGRGLGALLGDDVLKPESTASLSLPISQVETCSSQPRKLFDEEALAERAACPPSKIQRASARVVFLSSVSWGPEDLPVSLPALFSERLELPGCWRAVFPALWSG